MVQLDYGAIGLGVGGLVGHDASKDPDGPAFTRSNGQILYPGAYLRLGGRNIGVEGGTMALHQAVVTPFFGGYLGNDAGLRARLGLALPYAGSDLPVSYTFDLGFPVRSAVVQLGIGTGSGLAGSLRVGFPLP
jgi:hypothetical protein